MAMRNLSSPGRGWLLLALLSLAALISVRLSLDRAGLQVIQILFAYNAVQLKLWATPIFPIDQP
jgi:hypothetical protein